MIHPLLVLADKRDPSVVHVFAMIAAYEDRVLRVVYNANESPIRIITAFFDRSMKGKL